MSSFKHRFLQLTNPDAIRGERLVLAMLSFSWGLYLVGPIAPLNFLNIAGGFMFLVYGVSVVLDLLTNDNLRPSEGFYGCCLWVIGAAYQYKYELDDSIYLISVPLLLSWWVFANGLARLRE